MIFSCLSKWIIKKGEMKMGYPMYAVFCRNGHLTKVVKKREVNKVIIRKCKHCGSREFTSQFGWDDEENFECMVPKEPLGFEYIDDKKVFIFDVSGVTDWEHQPPDVIRLCRDCKEEFLLRRGEIDFFKKQGLALPRRCRKCRKAKRKTGCESVSSSM
jgi:hypothetical protein